MVRFQIKCFGDEAVIFDTASGDTHYLAPLTYALYTTSCKHPEMNSGEAPAKLALMFNFALDSAFTKLTNEAMVSLQHIGLLSRP